MSTGDRQFGPDIPDNLRQLGQTTYVGTTGARVDAQKTPKPMDMHDKNKIKLAISRARAIYPGPVAEVLAYELQAWYDFGYRLDKGGLIISLIKDLTRVRKPDEFGYDPYMDRE